MAVDEEPRLSGEEGVKILSLEDTHVALAVSKPTESEKGKQSVKRKQSLEASLTTGHEYGQNKKRNIQAFYSAVWPVLQSAGWRLVS